MRALSPRSIFFAHAVRSACGDDTFESVSDEKNRSKNNTKSLLGQGRVRGTCERLRISLAMTSRRSHLYSRERISGR